MEAEPSRIQRKDKGALPGFASAAAVSNKKDLNMAQPQQGDSSSSVPSIILVLIMSMGALWAYKVPLPSSRPAEAPVASVRTAAQQDIDARLWQDPLAAKKPESKSSQTIVTAPQSVQVKDGVVHIKLAIEGLSPQSTAGVPAPVCACTHTNESVQVMAVMLDGAPYAEAAESRRRTRYTVVSGLGRSQYVPVDREHIGSFTASVTAQQGITESVAIPFEWFRYDDIKKPVSSKKPVLVLWINEDPIRNQPLAGVKNIVEQACPCAGKRETVLIGPSSSDTLRTMLGEVKPYAVGKPDDEFKIFLGNLKIYSPKATAPDAYLVRGTSSLETVASELMDSVPGLQFHRTIATDDVLAEALVEELGRRDVHADDGIVLISEWDTTYGRILPAVFEKVMEKTAHSSPSKLEVFLGWIQDVFGVLDVDESSHTTLFYYSYLRGLDGKLPGDGADKKTEEGKKAQENEDPAIETAFGNHQKDYLRRIAARVADLDRRLKNCKKVDNQKETVCKIDGIKAIGILGSDVYDKLLILRALRERFPEVIFFTTDLDVGLLHADEWKFARNLVVASGYGLRLNGWLQREIPPFRDGYQTAYFLSVLAATLEPEREKLAIAHAERWTGHPRIFEIGRSQAVDLSITKEDIKECDLACCNSPHPYEPPTKPRLLWLAGLALLFILVIWLYQIKQIVDLWRKDTIGIGVTLRWVLWGGTALLIACLYWVGRGIWKDIFDIGTAGGGEPFSWFEGVSIWPSVLLRILTGVLALYLLLRGMRHLRMNDEKLTKSFFPDHGNTFFDCTWLSLCVRFMHVHGKGRACSCLLNRVWRWFKGERRKWEKAAFILRDAVQPRPFTLPLFGHLVGYVLLLLLVATLIIFSTGEPPNVPYRGSAAEAAHWYSLILSILSFLFLLAFVIDSTVRTRCLARRLGDSKRTQWPHRTVVKWFPEATPTQPEPVRQYQDDWLDIQLIAARTTVVGGFIYYPFLILSLMILARSSFIDNWQIPIGLAGVFVFYLLLALTCALLLRSAAERARRHALEHITQELVKALGDATRKQEVEQMKLMKDAILAEHRGAFSSFLHQPWLKAVLLPLGSYSGIQLMESLSSINL